MVEIKSSEAPPKDTKEKQESPFKLTRTSKKEKVFAGFFGIFVIIIILSISGVFSREEEKSQEASSEALENQAYIQGKKFVKDFLTSPSTVDFPFMDFSYVPLGNNEFKVSSYVDSENAFGGTVRNNWIMTIKYLGGNEVSKNSWRLEELIMNGNKIYP